MKGDDSVNKYKIGICVSLIMFIVLLFVAAVGIWMPYNRAESGMPENGVLTLHQQENGQWLLSWPAVENVDHYLVEILEEIDEEGKEPQIRYSATTEKNSGFLMPEVEGEQILRVNTAVRFRVFGIEYTRYGISTLEVLLRLETPTVTNLEWTADPEKSCVYVSFDLKNGDSCTGYYIEESHQYRKIQSLEDTHWTLFFGENGIMPLPDWDEQYGFALSVSRSEPGLEVHGMVTAEFSLERQDLLGYDLNAKIQAEEDYGFILTWQETKGAYYEIQRVDRSGDWTVVSRVDQGEELRFVSGPLAKFSNFYYRIVAVDPYGEGDTYITQTDVIHFETKASPMHATVWPMKDLDAYFDPRKTEAYSVAKLGKAYCVVDEKDGMFGVRIGDQIGYIDSNYCMINLPDYVGDLCSYQITNSTSSIYMIHDLEIPDVTAVVTKGDERVRLNDGNYLVPLLYPTAKKLAEAAQAAVDQGYKLKIYDSFRPRAATLEIYDLTEKILDDPISEEEDAKTYRDVMLDGRYSLNSFLAKGASRHNLGVALDLTLEELNTGKEVKMQTAIHDLSWYSVSSRNNAGAKKLASIMTEAGFAPLSSEWWHYQDDEATSQLSPPTVYNGVTAEGWTCDAQGWRYRDAKGRFMKDKTITIQDMEYTFDAAGYLTDGQPAFG